MVKKIIVYGRIPSKKNSRRVGRKGRKTFNLPSIEYEKWHEQQYEEVVRQCLATLTDIEEIQMEFYFPDLRRADLTNKAESIMDLLVDCMVIVDDNWKIVPRMILSAAGMDKNRPRVEVWIRHKD